MILSKMHSSDLSMISGAPVERVSSFKYLSVNISEDLTWTTHIQTQGSRKPAKTVPSATAEEIRVSPAILKTFYSGGHRKCTDSQVCSPLSAGLHSTSNAAKT